MLLRPTRRLLAAHSDSPLAPLLIGKAPSPPSPPPPSARATLKSPLVVKKETTYHFIHRQSSFHNDPLRTTKRTPDDVGSLLGWDTNWRREILDVDVTSIMDKIGIEADKPVFVYEWGNPVLSSLEDLSQSCLLGESVPHPIEGVIDLELAFSADVKAHEDQVLKEFDSPALQDFSGLALKATYEQLCFDLQTEEEWELLTGHKLGRSNKLSDMLIVRSRFDKLLERYRILEEVRNRVKESLEANLDEIKIPGMKK